MLSKMERSPDGVGFAGIRMLGSTRKKNVKLRGVDHGWVSVVQTLESRQLHGGHNFVLEDWKWQNGQLGL